MYKKGNQINDIYKLLDLILNEKTVWYRNKARNAAFIQNWTLNFLEQEVKKNHFFYAVNINK